MICPIQHNFTPQTWRLCLKQLSFGKRLPDAVYWHICGLADVPVLLAEFVQPLMGVHQFTVVKCATSNYSVSLLNYPDFFVNPFPILTSSYKIDLNTGKGQSRHYNVENPPILHRKELLLPPHHPQITEWQIVTCMLEQAGLFEQPRKIGFKRYWDALLLSKNIDLDYS